MNFSALMMISSSYSGTGCIGVFEPVAGGEIDGPVVGLDRTVFDQGTLSPFVGPVDGENDREDPCRCNQRHWKIGNRGKSRQRQMRL